MTNKQETQFQLDMPFSEADEPTGDRASPFVKWAGGKRNIIDELKARLPDEFNHYYEPFVGGGALFFELYDQLPAAYLSDVNFDLILAYNVIKNDSDELIELLKKHAVKHSKDYYYKVRSQHELQGPVKIAARFLYLNRTCYNGLYRVNKKGEFNVPMGSYKNPNITQEDNIRACSSALQIATIEYRSFDKITPQSGDFVYFDPPYHPTDENNFTSYTSQDFTEKDQVSLRDFALYLHRQGVKVMLSNSNAKFINGLYKAKPFHVRIVHAPRLVNCKPNGRNNVEEVLITTYE